MRLVVAALIVDDLSRPRQVLAARRTAPSELAGRWEFPGGQVEDGESAEEALSRELAEELQIGVRLGDEVSGPAGGRWPVSDRFEMRTWLAQISTGEPQPTGSHDEVRWLDHLELAALDWLDADRAIVTQLARRLLPVDLPVEAPVGVVIEPATYDDLDVVELTAQVQEFYVQLYGGRDESPMSVAELAPPNGQFLLARRDGQPVAMGGWRFLPPFSQVDAHRPVELKRMFVRPEARGRGLGSALLRTLEQGAARAGADWSLLQTGAPQVDAVALYRRMGYREVPPFGYFACTPGALHLGRPLDAG